MRHIAPPTACNQNLRAKAPRAIQHHDAGPSRLIDTGRSNGSPGPDGCHQTRCATADNRNVCLIFHIRSVVSVRVIEWGNCCLPLRKLNRILGCSVQFLALTGV